VVASETEDHFNIMQLMARYVHSLDFERVDDFVACFAIDGAFEIEGLPKGSPLASRYSGRAGLVSLANFLFDMQRGHIRHWNLHPLIQIGTSGSARVSSYVAVVRVGQTPNAGILLTGLYEDELIKHEGTWLILKRTFTADRRPEQSPVDRLVIRRDQFVEHATKGAAR
jgi:hypothetical protein